MPEIWAVRDAPTRRKGTMAKQKSPLLAGVPPPNERMTDDQLAQRRDLMTKGKKRGPVNAVRWGSGGLDYRTIMAQLGNGQLRVLKHIRALLLLSLAVYLIGTVIGLILGR